MKTTIFFKIVLGLIAALLTLNLFKDYSSIPFLETKAEASIPVFIQIGKSYECILLERVESQNFEILQIDKVNGWMEARWEWKSDPKAGGGIRWFNLNHFQSCSEIVKTQPIKSDK
jgi:hypothetical protein